MKKNIKRFGLVTLMVAFCMAACLTFSGFMDTEAAMEQTAETKEIREAFIQAQETALRLGQFVSDTGRTAALSEQELNQCVSEYAEQVERYFARENPCRENYPVWHEELVRDIYQTTTDYTVDSGILRCDFEQVSLEAGGDTALVQAKSVSWAKWVEQNEDGQFEIAAPVNRDTITARMIREDGSWKLLETLEMQKESREDAENRLEQLSTMVQSAPEEQISPNEREQAKQICTLDYHSFEEALKAIQTIDIAVLDPFAQLDEMEKIFAEENQ